ncbi:lamin tail domain-containing protein [Halalkalicoccus ordinarius]|uniref:lamin tail domain-containing protein n=1 Tax=Halalkalicoccus ordinarius TaxID=3116651 RepID=UPI00300F5ED6
MSDGPRATTNRRTVLKAGGTLALAGLITPAATVAQTDLPIEIEQNAKEEYVVLRNVGDDDVDLTGYSINFEAEDEDYDQVRQLSGDVTLASGEEVTVATGDETTDSTDVTLVDPYDGHVLRNDGSDEIALLDPDGNTVVSTAGSGESDPGDGGDESERTLTITVVDENDESVEGANVSVVTSDGGEEVASGETDSDGTVTFDVESGEYDVIVEHDDVTGPAATPATVDDTDPEVSVTLDMSDDTATGIVRVVDQNDDPVEGEPVTLWPPGTVDEEATETRETNADGEVVIELLAGEPEDVVMFETVVRNQSKTLGIMSDEHAGVQEVVFEVDTSDDSDDEDGQTQELDRDDGDDEDMDEKSGDDDEDVTDADGDGVAATDDADDDCPKES